MRTAPARAAVSVRLSDQEIPSQVLLHVLAGWLVPGALVQVTRRPGLRPLVSAGRRVYASASGTTGATAASVGDSPVGVDIERLRTVREPERVGQCLDQVLAPWPESCAHRGGIVRWTRYEAVVKALGVGLSVPPSRVGVATDGSVSLDGRPIPLCVVSWLAGDVDRTPQFAVSVATRVGTAVLTPAIRWRHVGHHNVGRRATCQRPDLSVHR